jgi:hypothetical protein
MRILVIERLRGVAPEKALVARVARDAPPAQMTEYEQRNGVKIGAARAVSPYGFHL